jgi:hypothetical protein
MHHWSTWVAKIMVLWNVASCSLADWYQCFCLIYSKMELEEGSSRTLVSVGHIRWLQITEGCNLNCNCCKNFKSHISYTLIWIWIYEPIGNFVIITSDNNNNNNSVALVCEQTRLTEQLLLSVFCYYFILVAQVYSQGWVDPFPDRLLRRKCGSARNRTQTCGSVVRSSDH